MAAPKGTRPPAAGKGRKKGVPNRTPAALREVVAQFVEKNADGAQALYERVAKSNPAKALELLARFAEFVLPRQREVNGTLATFTFDANAPIRDAAHAARVYSEILGNPGANLDAIVFEAPAPSAGAPAIAAPIEQPIDPRVAPKESKDTDLWSRLAE